MTVRLPANSTGTILDTQTESGKDRQVVVVREPVRPAPTRSVGGRIIYVEDFRGIQPGFWNDGVGVAHRDCDIMFNGKPTMRLDPLGNTSGGSNPGRTAVTTGVITKRRIHDGYRHKFGMEMWFRMTSLNLTSNCWLSMSVYNRDGTNAHHARVWLDPNGNNVPLLGKILDGDASNTAGSAVWVTAVTSVLQNGAGTHTYDVPSGRLDRVGGWHSVKLVVDFVTKKYVSLALDGEALVDLSAYNMDTTASTGFAGMHHSIEFAATTSTRRFVNVANVIGTLED